jgi:hypothetical protein
MNCLATREEIYSYRCVLVKVGLTVADGGTGCDAGAVPGKSRLCRMTLQGWCQLLSSFSCSALFRTFTLPFRVAWLGDTTFRVIVDGYADIVRKEVLSLYSEEQPGMSVELADLRLFYVDSDGDQLEIVSDRDVYTAVRDYAINLKGKNLRITSPMVKKEGFKGRAPVKANANAANELKAQLGESATLSPSNGAHTETGSTSKTCEEAAQGNTLTFATASQTLGVVASSNNEPGHPSKTNEMLASSKPLPLVEAMNGAVASLVMASRSAATAFMGHDSEDPSLAKSLDGSLLLRLAGVTSTTIALCNHVRDASERVPQLSSSVKDESGSAQSASMASKTVSAPSFTASPPPLREVPFIHGRDKCVKCLANPIMGKRYRLTNVEGCHFCEACFGKTRSSILDFALEEIGTYSFAGFSRSLQ